MHIIENKNSQAGRVYCYAADCIWNKEAKRYDKPRISVGHLDGEPPCFVPNNMTATLFTTEASDPRALSSTDNAVIDALVRKYGTGVRSRALECATVRPTKGVAAALAVFPGPSMVFGGISEKYRIQQMLGRAFGEDDARAILSLSWYIAAEGGALVNSDVWLGHFDNPAGRTISSQEITKLLDRMDDGRIMAFYKDWMAGLGGKGDKSLYDLTSISWYGHGIDMASWGHNRDNENLPQVNYALLCARNTGMPLFAWPLEGSISDVRTLQTTLQFLEKFRYTPDCLMMDRGFASMENITYMLKKKYTFLQAVKTNANWVRDVIDAGREARLRPNSMVKSDDRTYYASTSRCQWTTIKKTGKNGSAAEETVAYVCQSAKGEKYAAGEGEEIVSQFPCFVHVLFCQDLVGPQWDNFMGKLKQEQERLLSNDDATPSGELRRFFRIERKKWARRRSVDFDMGAIERQKDRYAGYVCYITNDRTIATAADALSEYSTRDYIEKDFDEMKNDLDMRRIRVHTDGRMKARLFIQLLSEIFTREIRVCLRQSDDCRKMTRKQIISHIKSIYKIKFKGKYRDVCPELSKNQKAILDALKLRDSR